MKNLFIVVFIMVLLSACGAKGDLVLEPESLPLKIKDLTVNQIGLDMNFKFSLPELLSDNKVLDRNSISKIIVYHSNTNIPEENFRKKGSVLLRTKKSKKFNLTESGKSVVKIPFKLKDLNKKEHFFGIIYYVGSKRSPMSVIKSISTAIPYKTINKVDIEQERKIIILKWKKPEYDLSKSKVSQIAGFYIYRKIEKENIEDPNAIEKEINKNDPDFVKVNSELITNEYYEDKDISINGKYFYRVATVYNKKVESFPSRIVSIELKDTYPPDVPENLFVFKGAGFMLLNWEGVNDNDLDHYVVYKKKTNKGQFKKIADNVTKLRYKDNSVKNGILYFYYVVSVDKKGNESEPSIIVKERY